MSHRRLAAREAFAIVRLDRLDHRPVDFEQEGSGPDIGSGPVDVTVKEVVLGLAAAKREVERLNGLNESKGCRYFWQSTRLFDDGGSFGAR